MRNRLKRFFILALITTIIISSITVYATEDNKTEEKKSESTSAAVKGDDSYLTFTKDKTAISRAKGFVSVMKADGFSDAAITGVLSMSWGESGWDPLNAEKPGVKYRGAGLFGFTPISTFGNSSQNAKCPHGKKSIKYGGAEYCSNGACQISYMMTKLGDCFRQRPGWMKKYNAFCKSGAMNGQSYNGWTIKDVPFPVEEVDSVSQFKSINNPETATVVFLCVYGNGASNNAPIGGKNVNAVPDNGYSYTNGQWFLHDYAKQAGHFNYLSPIYKWITANTFTAADGSSQMAMYETDENGEVVMDEEGNPIVDTEAVAAATGVAESLRAEGYWSVEDLSNYNHLVEDYIDISGSIDDMTQDERNSLAIWQNNIDFMDSQNGVWHKILTFFMACGILTILFGICYYMLYWFDKSFLLGQAIEGGLMGLVTSLLPFTKKHMVAWDDTNPTLLTKGADVVVVTHRRALITALVSVLLGVLMVSGLAFRIIAKLIIFLHTYVTVLINTIRT